MKQTLLFLLFPFLFVAQTPSFKQLMDNGDRKYAVKSYKEAYKEYDAALKLIASELDLMSQNKQQIGKDHADWLKCLVYRARCAYYTSNIAQATADADKILSVDSLNADAKAVKSYVKYKGGDKMNACRELKTEHKKGNELSGKIYEDCFCWSEGITQFREANSAFSLAKNAEALNYVDNAIDILPDSISYQVKKGEIALKMENYNLAHTVFSTAINKDPTNFKGWYLRGITNLKMEKNDSAFNDISECIKLNSFSYEAYYKRAEICIELEQYQSAIYDYNQCLRIKPNEGELYFKIAIIKRDNILDELGACEAFKKAAALGYEEANEFVLDCNTPKKKKKN